MKRNRIAPRQHLINCINYGVLLKMETITPEIAAQAVHKYCDDMHYSDPCRKYYVRTKASPSAFNKFVVDLIEAVNLSKSIHQSVTSKKVQGN